MPRPNTRDHARQVLAGVDPSAKIVDAWREHLASAKSPGPRFAPELVEWCLEHISAVSDAQTLPAAAEDANVVTLLAIGHLAFASESAIRLPKLRRSLKLPKRLVKLERDLFPTLLEEIKSNTDVSPSFAAQLANARTEVTALLPRLGAMVTPNPGPRSSKKRASAAAAASNPGVGDGLVFLAFIGVVAAIYKKTVGD